MSCLIITILRYVFKVIKSDVCCAEMFDLAGDTEATYLKPDMAQDVFHHWLKLRHQVVSYAAKHSHGIKCGHCNNTVATQHTVDCDVIFSL